MHPQLPLWRLVVACAYGTLEYVKSLHQAFQNTKDPIPKMLNIATFHNRPEIVEYCIGAGARLRSPYDLHGSNVMGSSYETCKVLVEHGLNINAAIECFGDISECAVEDDNLDWVRFCSANPNLIARLQRTPYPRQCSYFCLLRDI